MKKWFILSLIPIVLAVAAGLALAAPNKTMWEYRKANTEMRQNVTWMMEGLLKLSQSNDKRLGLTYIEKKRIFPLVQSMVDHKIIILKVEDRFGNRRNRGTNQNQFQGSPDPNDPAVKARIREMQDQTGFGNQQTDKIDAILNKAQKRFVDNMNFNPEQYGYIDFSKLFNGQTPGGQGQRPDPGKMKQIRDQMRAGLERQAELNRKVMALLQRK